MSRRLRSWTFVLLSLLATVPVACDYGDPAKKPRVYGQIPQNKNRPRTAAAPGTTSTADSSSGGSADQKEKREAILNNVLQLIQSAALTPGKQHFAIAVQNLNQYFEQDTRPSDYYLSVDSRKFLQPQLQKMTGTPEAVRELEAPTFGNMDARHIEDCMLYSEVAHRIAGERRPGETNDLPRVRRLFDWMVRQVQLVPLGSLAPPGGQHVPARPYDVMLRGMGTEVSGGWSERGWIFMSLCRQLNIDVGLVSFTPLRAPAAIALAPVDEETAKQPVVWVCAALVDGEAYLFDQRLGVAIPDARGDGVATLRDVLADPRILDRLELPGQGRYDANRSMLASSGKLTILIDSSRGYFSPKMRLLQSRLTGKNRAVLFRDPVEQARHFVTSAGGIVGDVQLWPLPYGVQTALTTQPEFTQSALYPLRPFRGELPLLYARVTQLKGDLAEATSRYVNMRFKEGALQSDKKTPITPAEQHQIDVFATYFLGLCRLEEGNPARAADFFQQLLKQTPEPDPSRPEPRDMFRWGACTNLGLIAASAGDVPTATRYLAALTPTTQYQGNLWLARNLALRDPLSKPAPQIPPAPPAPITLPTIGAAIPK